MARLWLLMLSIVLVTGVPAGAVGGANAMSHAGMPDWAVAIRLDAPASNSDGSAVGQTLGGDVGLTEPIREQLANRETLGAAVGMSDPVRQCVTAWENVGDLMERPIQVQQRAINQENTDAAVGALQQVRERLAAMIGAS